MRKQQFVLEFRVLGENWQDDCPTHAVVAVDETLARRILKYMAQIRKEKWLSHIAISDYSPDFYTEEPLLDPAWQEEPLLDPAWQLGRVDGLTFWSGSLTAHTLHICRYNSAYWTGFFQHTDVGWETEVVTEDQLRYLLGKTGKP